MNTRIKELRLSKGLSQLALAMKVGCSQNTISRIELGLSEPNSTILLNIAAYFNTSVDYLLFKTNQKEILPPMDTACLIISLTYLYIINNEAVFPASLFNFFLLHS